MTETGEQSIAKWAVLAGKQITLHLGQQLDAIGVSASQYYYLLKIHDNPGMTQGALLETEFINPSNVARAVKQLMAQGFVRRERSATDKRAQELWLTAQGAAIYPQIRAILDREEAQLRTAVQRVYPDFDAKQFVDVLHLLSRIHGDAAEDSK